MLRDPVLADQPEVIRRASPPHDRAHGERHDYGAGDANHESGVRNMTAILSDRRSDGK
jgi:hypothetical protein